MVIILYTMLESISTDRDEQQNRALYDNLPFDNQNGGVWIQGFDIQYNTSQWTSNNKLKIIIMPHSHCDPGYLPIILEYNVLQ
ncbi:unnamed protein product [Rotaria sp. Silwood2]|nr:unnamed protein product [Rotaria sp. Silwood2]